MFVKSVPYINPTGYLFLDQKSKLAVAKRINKQMTKFGLTASDINHQTI
jgi:transposase